MKNRKREIVKEKWKAPIEEKIKMKEAYLSMSGGKSRMHYGPK